MHGSMSTVPSGQVCHCETMEVVLQSYAKVGRFRCGVLQVGDRVLTINDWYTANGTIDEANRLMRHSSSPLTLTVEFDVIESLLPPNGILNVKLAKRGNNLGIIARGETDGRKGEPVIISDIRTGSVAQRFAHFSLPHFPTNAPPFYVCLKVVIGEVAAFLLQLSSFFYVT
uniref:PDZ domain-containing protein n=1 Tax=Parascaris equorum TaxID=6256 RepID=A0A914RLD0_PAREQ